MAFIRGNRRRNDNDILEGTNAIDTIFGYGGDDTLTGLGGDDYMRGDDGNDSLEGGDGNDQLFGNDGDDAILGGNGNDFAKGDEGNDSLDGGDGEDQLFGNSGNDEILGGDGNDLLDGGDGEDGIDGGSGNDTLIGGSNSSVRTTREEIIKDDDGNIIFTGTFPTREFTGGDTLVGGAGDDLILANAGDDIADGGADNDTIIGGAGSDLIFGGTGDDEITGGTDDDTLSGESGNDTLIGGSGKDFIIGDQDAFQGPDGDDEINAGSDDDRVYGGGGSDTILGGSGNDLIDGGDSRSSGLAGRDNNGNDELFGGEGNDTIRGGLGSDTLNGGGTKAGEVDVLFGSGVIDGQGGFFDATSDLFILGNETSFLYGAGAGDVIGTDIFGQSDRAIILLFENGVDKIQVPNPDQVATAVIGNSRFILIPRNGGFEIIAELQNFTDVLAPGTFVTPPIDNSGDNDFQGTENNDLLDGGEGNDTLTGLGGDDILDGGAGSDSLDGGDGIDTVRYENDSAAVQVNLATQTATDGFGDTDTLLNIENVVGSAFADSIFGDAQDNNLNGGTGDDTLEGGAGNDILEGGDGIDTVTYENDIAGINVNLTTQTVADGFGGTDTVLNIENVVGSEFADVIVGDAQDNNLSGGAGNDILLGAAGADFMVGTSATTGGTGEIDRLIGGSADGVRDVFSIVESGTNNVFYVGGAGSDFAQIENFELGVDRIGINNNLLGNIFLGNSGSNAVLGFTGNGGIDVVAVVVGIDAVTLSQQSFLTLV